MTENEVKYELDVPFEVFSSLLPECVRCGRAYSSVIEVCTGSVVLAFADGDVLLKKGEVCLIRPFSAYSIKELKGSVSEIRFDVHTLELPSAFMCSMYRCFGEICGDDSLYTVFSDSEINRQIEKIRNSYKIGYFATYPEVVILLNEMSRKMKASDTAVQIEHICEYIDVRSSEQIEASEVSEMCGMSYPSFARKFHEHYGRSFKEHINYVRTVKARMMLLNTNKELNEIARDAGFFDCSHFIRTYRKRFGTTPNKERIYKKN